MKNFITKVFTCVFVCAVTLIHNPVTAQNKSDLISFFDTLNQSFLKTGQLSYLIKYTYANEHRPNIILDSLTARVVADGKRYYYNANNTEVFCNDSISITLLNENKIMYLSHAKSVSSFTSPGIFDSLIRMESSGYKITEGPKQRVLQVSFSKNSNYKTVSVFLNKQREMTDSIKYVVKTDQLMEEGASSQDLSGYDAYAIVTAKFIEDKNIDTTVLQFSPSAFYKKAGKKIIAVGKYADYSVSLGSLNF